MLQHSVFFSRCPIIVTTGSGKKHLIGRIIWKVQKSYLFLVCSSYKYENYIKSAHKQPHTHTQTYSALVQHTLILMMIGTISLKNAQNDAAGEIGCRDSCLNGYMIVPCCIWFIFYFITSFPEGFYVMGERRNTSIPSDSIEITLFCDYINDKSTRKEEFQPHNKIHL